MRGKVWMVGTGPGNPDLITVRGREVLDAAEVLVYDGAVGAGFVDLAPDGAEVFNVGSQPPLHSMSHGEITDLLAQKARDGKNVVRLLGGDPFVFGPGVEEAEALAAARVPFEIVPGVTSTVAAPAYAGIPILHPNSARSYAVLTGDAASTAAESLIDWSSVAAGTETLVFVNAAENLPVLTDRLIASGRVGDTPAAVVSWGTHGRQRTVVGTLGTIAGLVDAAGLHSPAITVVGDVVRLRERLRWYDDRPLFNQRVLLTRTRRGASDIRRLLEDQGADVVELPTQELVDVITPEIFDRVAEALTDSQYGWAIFSSARAVEMFFRQLRALNRDARAFHATRVVAGGPRTAETLAAHGILADEVVDDPSPTAILAAMGDRNLTRRRVLLPRAEGSQQDLLKGLRRAGAEVEDVPLYVASVPRQPDREALGRLRHGEVDAVVFPASSAVTNLVQMLDGDVSALRPVMVACSNHVAADVARRAGIRVDVVGEPATPVGLVRALSNHARQARSAGGISTTPRR